MLRKRQAQADRAHSTRSASPFIPVVVERVRRVPARRPSKPLPGHSAHRDGRDRCRDGRGPRRLRGV